MADTFSGDNSYAGGISFSPTSLVLGAPNGAATTGGFSFDLPLATVASFTNRAFAFSSANSANNQGFLSGVLNKTQASVTDSTNAGYGFLSSTVNTLSAMNTTNQMNLSYRANVNAPKKAGGGGCFITTAICEARELPDDCEELTILRHFRDTYMLATCKGRNMVRRYYEVAPKIAGRLSYAQCEFLRRHYLVPAIEAIKSGKFEKAVSLYSLMVVESENMTGA